MNILDKILNHKKMEIDKIPEQHVLSSSFKRLSLKKALKADKMSIIAEIKFASPSEGVILKNGEHIQKFHNMFLILFFFVLVSSLNN